MMLNLQRYMLFESEIKSLSSLNSQLQRYVDKRLWLKVVIAIFLGVGVGFMLSPSSGWFTKEFGQSIGSWLALPGTLFLKLVQMIMIPLIFASIVRGITSNDQEQLKKMGGGVILYFISTTVVSILIGVVISLALQPGKMLPQQSKEAEFGVPTIESGEGFDFKNVPNAITDLLPENPLASMVTGEMLSIVIFTIIIGIAITSLSKEMKQPIEKLLGAIQEICMTVVNWAMKLVPVAVFGLMAQLSASLGLNSLIGLGFYVLVVLIGLVLLLGFYGLILFILGKENPFKFFGKIKEVQLLAFSTTSSAAVMPLSLKTAEETLKVKPSVSNFIIPIGATVNMDGTAVYQCITTMFIAQAYGMDLDLMNTILIMFTLVAASIGTPAIPGGGVVILASVLQSAGIPTEGIVIIIGVERVLGMFRTAVNVTGDLTACVVFNRFQKK